MAADKTQPQVKQGAVTPRTLRVANFRGAYGDARFNDEGVSEQPVSQTTEAQLRTDFPNAEIEVVEAVESKSEETK
jgi:hypothetical protein